MKDSNFFAGKRITPILTPGFRLISWELDPYSTLYISLLLHFRIACTLISTMTRFWPCHSLLLSRKLGWVSFPLPPTTNSSRWVLTKYLCQWLFGSMPQILVIKDCCLPLKLWKTHNQLSAWNDSWNSGFWNSKSQFILYPPYLSKHFSFCQSPARKLSLSTAKVESKG